MKYIDPGIDRKSKILKESISLSKGLLLPSAVEISESKLCNRACSFCPKSDPEYPNENKFISSKLVEKLTIELSELNYRGMLIFSGFCEPFLDKNIYNLISISRSNLKHAHIEIVTNGDVLNEERIKLVFDSGLDRLIISAYDNEEQVEYFNKMVKSAGFSKSRIFIRPRYLSKENDFGITLNNRAGLMQNAIYSIHGLENSLQKRCNYPFYNFFMDYDGDVLVCAHDWGKN